MRGLQRGLIADASPLIAFAKIQKLNLLEILFSKVFITELVARELGISKSSISSQFPESKALLDAITDGWLMVTSNAQIANNPYQPINPGVDEGEASAIALAIEKQTELPGIPLLIDDRCGRAEASLRGLKIIGSAAILILAKEYKLIDSCAALLGQMRRNGYYLSDELIAAVLSQVNE